MLRGGEGGRERGAHSAGGLLALLCRRPAWGGGPLGAPHEPVSPAGRAGGRRACVCARGWGAGGGASAAGSAPGLSRRRWGPRGGGCQRLPRGGGGQGRGCCAGQSRLAAGGRAARGPACPLRARPGLGRWRAAGGGRFSQGCAGVPAGGERPEAWPVLLPALAAEATWAGCSGGASRRGRGR